MKSAFWLFFGGFILQYDFINIKGFDVLPDFVGYILIYKGICSILEESEYFSTAKKLSMALIVLSLVNFYSFNFDQMIFSTFPIINLIKLFVFAVELFLVYNLCKGIIEIAASKRNKYAMTTINQRMYVFLVSGCAIILTSLISPFFSGSNFRTQISALALTSNLVYYFALLILATGMLKMNKEFFPPEIKVAPNASSKTSKKSSSNDKKIKYKKVR